MQVRIKRNSTDWKEDAVDVSVIENIKWDHVGGGVCIPEAHCALYGYIPYALASELQIGCSGRHNFGNNSAKVRITKPKNKSDECYEGYVYLKEKAGPKPDSNFPKTECGKIILEIIKKSQMSRKEVMEMVIKKGGKKEDIPKTIRGLVDHGYIVTEGSGHSGNQIIRRYDYNV